MDPDQEQYREPLPEDTIEHSQETPRPSLLDVVKIDNRWAQVRGGGNFIQFPWNLNDTGTVGDIWFESHVLLEIVDRKA